MSEYEYFGAPLTALDVNGVLEGGPYTSAFMIANNDSPHLARIIREMECENISIVMDDTGDRVIDAILSRPNQRFGLQIRSITQGEIDHILGVLTNLTSLTFTNLVVTQVRLRTLPLSLTELQIYDFQLWDVITRLLDLNLRNFTVNAAENPLQYGPGWADAVAQGVHAMSGLRRLSLSIPVNVDPMPILRALPPSIESVHLNGWMNAGELFARYIQARLVHPNLEYFAINHQWMPKP